MSASGGNDIHPEALKIDANPGARSPRGWRRTMSSGQKRRPPVAPARRLRPHTARQGVGLGGFCLRDKRKVNLRGVGPAGLCGFQPQGVKFRQKQTWAEAGPGARVGSPLLGPGGTERSPSSPHGDLGRPASPDEGPRPRGPCHGGDACVHPSSRRAASHSRTKLLECGGCDPATALLTSSHVT